ncbi:hypothetical protein [Corynebacterium halotolerans]|uniref:hypothetical protein n=1 Tax=Corynebacterium halotolerans TaxID=225326 RepID=UPI003CF537DC
MVTVEFALRGQRVAHLSALLDTLRTNEGFGPEREAALLARLRAAGPAAHRVILRSTPGTFTVETRPLPPAATDQVILDAAGTVDQRTHPTRPGPDRGWQSRQLAWVRGEGAGESVLLDKEGAVISAIAAPLLLLTEASVHVSTHPRATPSVMLDGVVAHLAELGLEVVAEPGGFPMSPLRRCEVWVLDPVAGIQLVTGWLEYGSIMGTRPLSHRAAPDHRTVETWRWETADAV